MALFLKINPTEKKILLKLSRQGFYFTLLIVIILSLWQLSSLYKTRTFSEHGLVENIQLCTLFLSTLIFLYTGFKNSFYRPIVILLASLTTFCFFRELDSVFDVLFPKISWKFAFLTQ